MAQPLQSGGFRTSQVSQVRPVDPTQFVIDPAAILRGFRDGMGTASMAIKELDEMDLRPKKKQIDLQALENKATGQQIEGQLADETLNYLDLVKPLQNMPDNTVVTRLPGSLPTAMDKPVVKAPQIQTVEFNGKVFEATPKADGTFEYKELGAAKTKTGEPVPVGTITDIGGRRVALRRDAQGNLVQEDLGPSEGASKQKVADEDALSDLDATLSQFEEAYSNVEKGIGVSPWYVIPGLEKAASVRGWDNPEVRQQLREIKVSESLLNAAKTKGAISDREMKLFLSPVPGPEDSTLPAYLKRRVETLQKVKRRLQNRLRVDGEGKETATEAAPAQASGNDEVDLDALETVSRAQIPAGWRTANKGALVFDPQAKKFFKVVD